MSRLKRFTKAYSVVIILALVLASSIFIFTASAADNNNVYYACVNQSSGTIKMIGAQDSCKNTEMKISWKQVGPAGPQGIKGDTGPTGPPGSAASINTHRYTETLTYTTPSPEGDIIHEKTVYCGPGEKVVSGGFGNSSLYISPVWNGPSSQGEGWTATFRIYQGWPGLWSSPQTATGSI